MAGWGGTTPIRCFTVKQEGKTMPKYRLTPDQVDTLIDALDDAVQYRALLARASATPNGFHSQKAGDYEDLLLAARSVSIERITVRHLPVGDYGWVESTP